MTQPKKIRCDCSCPDCGVPGGTGSCTCGCHTCTSDKYGYTKPGKDWGKLTKDEVAVLCCLVEDHLMKMFWMPKWRGKKKAMEDMHVLEAKLDKLYADTIET